MSIASLSEKRIQWDKTLVSEAAAGNWSWIHSDLGIPIGHMKPGVSRPCPKKGGKDKFKLYSDYLDTGGSTSEAMKGRPITSEEFDRMLNQVAEPFLSPF